MSILLKTFRGNILKGGIFLMISTDIHPNKKVANCPIRGRGARAKSDFSLFRATNTKIRESVGYKSFVCSLRAHSQFLARTKKN